MAWLVMQVADVILNNIGSPDWVFQVLLLFLAIGLPFAVFFAWAFELTPEGLKRESEADRSKSITQKTGRKLDFAIIAALSIVVILLVGKDRLVGDRAPLDASSALGKSIAVLRFDNRSADAENAEFIAAGVHDELLTLLSKLSDLRVISRTSVERLDRNLSIPEIGALLSVATVLEGQVQRAGDRLRINVQLIDAAREDHLWATTYDRELTAENIFDVQSDIARTIADALHAQISAGDEALLEAVPTENTEALNRYLLGRQLMNHKSFQAFRQASIYFIEATELDSNYAQAWVSIAENSSQMLATGLIDLQEYFSAAEPAIKQALKLDNRLPEAHAQMATFRWLSGDFDAAEASFKMALELNPSDTRSLEKYGEYFRSTHRPLEAIPVLKRALDNDPLSVEILFELGRSELYAGRSEQNVVYSKRILEIDPSNVAGYIGLLQAYSWQGRFDLMWPWHIKAIASDPEDFELWASFSFYAEMLGDSELADRYIDRAVVFGPGEPAVLSTQACILSLNGNSDKAVEIARQALQAELDDRWGSNQIFLRLVRDDALRTGAFDSALAWYRTRHPEFFAVLPEITFGNIVVAADLALLLRRAGKPEAADVLINTALAWYRETQIPGVHGELTNIVDVELLALNGEKDAAINSLREAVDGGWRNLWKWHLGNENLASLHGEPGFQAIIEQLENDMAAQLEAIHALPYMGEFDLRSAQSHRWSNSHQ